MTEQQFFVVCHVPITGEQYVVDIADRKELETFLLSDEDERAAYIIEGTKRRVEDF